MSIIKEMISVRKFSDWGTIYWLILIKATLAILAIVYGG